MRQALGTRGMPVVLCELVVTVLCEHVPLRLSMKVAPTGTAQLVMAKF